MKPTLIEFETPDHLLLPGFLFEPKVKSKHSLIVLHGNGSSSILGQLKSTEQFVTDLTTRGIAYFTFNNRGASYINKISHIDKTGEKRQKYGMSYELIKECTFDIDGAISFLKQQDYDEFSLIGFSTGANKICAYNYDKPKNEISRYILVCGGDDTGLYFTAWGKPKYERLLKLSQRNVQEGKGRDLVLSLAKEGMVISYQSLLDIIDPNGAYNTFPYLEVLNKMRLGTKSLFQEYASIKKPTLVIYGENDEYCYGQVPKVVQILKEASHNGSNFSYQIIPGSDHGFTGKETELSKSVSKFLASW